jgi:uncharacterized protein
MNPVEIINAYYKPGSKAHDILVRHGEAVARKAVAVASRVRRLNPDIEFIRDASMLHDIGIFLTRTPDLGCFGEYPYVCHGYLGRELLEKRNLPKHALVCERHVGLGITAEEIRRRRLPLPQRDMTPVSIEEQIICYSDKFFSKKRLKTEKEDSVKEVLRSLKPYDRDRVIAFKKWLQLFK